MKHLLASAFFLASISGFSQEYKPGKIDFSFGVGFQSYSSSSVVLNDFRAKFPDSELLQGEFDNHAYSPYYYNTNASTMINLLWGVHLKENAGFEQRLRIGVSYSGYTPSYGSFYKENKFAFDTLTSSVTGERTFVDSVYSENLSIYTSEKQVGLDVSYLLKANQHGRWGFYAGVGLEVGALLDAKATITRGDNSYLTNGAGNYYENESMNFYGNDHDYEEEKLDGGFYTSLYLPVGLDLRLSMKNEFWKKMHLYIELRPNVQYRNSSLTDNNLALGFGMAAFGVRAEF